ncbi:methyl-accepting chemotaxis protein [Methylopila capsulata]|nr:HAMP domain-containing methyl-accepting chemotaxis protein [Methylopila capsulata]MBM7852218.1 methyl-accepting chemotaxis protein [Methylopila capsulata]
MTSIDDSYRAFIAQETKAASSARRVNRAVFEMNYALYRAIAETETAQVTAAEARFAAAKALGAQILTSIRDQAPSFAGRVDDLQKNFDLFSTRLTKAWELSRTDQTQDALNMVHREVDPVFEELTQSSTKLGDDIAAYVDEGSDRLNAQTNSTRWTLISVSGAGVLAGFAIAVMVVLSITKPLGRLVDVLQRMARGDVGASIDEARRGDEIGAVGRAVEGIREMVATKAAEDAERQRIAADAAAQERKRTSMKLADDFEKAIGGVVNMVSSAATEMQATAQQLTATAQQTSSQSAVVASGAEEAAANVTSVAASAEQLGASVSEIGRQVERSAHMSHSAVGETEQTAAIVSELSEAAARIDGIVAMISDIAAQTNLLALNATIEAARAGEAGRGFAVVAAEVKELANQTAKATAEIGQQISGVQLTTGRAVKAIEAISGTIRDISETATAIASAVEEQGAATQEIVKAVSQASVGAGEVTANIAGVSRAADETGAGASQVLSAASELATQSETLRHEVQTFLAGVRAA